MHTHTHIYSFSYSFPFWFITGHCIQFPVLYSKTLLFIHPIYTILLMQFLRHLQIRANCNHDNSISTKNSIFLSSIPVINFLLFLIQNTPQIISSSEPSGENQKAIKQIHVKKDLYKEEKLRYYQMLFQQKQTSQRHSINFCKIHAKRIAELCFLH